MITHSTAVVLMALMYIAGLWTPRFVEWLAQRMRFKG